MRRSIALRAVAAVVHALRVAMFAALRTVAVLATVFAAVAVLSSGVLGGGAQPAHANGVPTLVSLAYIPELSNWGPESATGEVELIFAEGFVRLAADGLPPLTAERYQGWIVNSQTNDAISVGRFNANLDGEVQFEGTLPPLADFGFDLFIVTVEAEPDDAPQPTANRSIGGRFSLVGVPAADGSNPESQQNDGTAPAQLPNTGDPTLVTDIGRVALLVGALAFSVVVALRIARRPAEGGQS